MRLHDKATTGRSMKSDNSLIIVYKVGDRSLKSKEHDIKGKAIWTEILNRYIDQNDDPTSTSVKVTDPNFQYH